MYFKDIIGKEQIKQNLIRAVNKGKIPHAQMMLGKEGCGHLPMALALASYILCSDRQENDSCGICSSCIKSHKFSHPDLHFAFPVIKYPKDKKRDDTTSNTWLKEWRKALAEQPFMDITTWQSVMGAENSQPNISKKECVEIVHKLGMKTFEADHKVLILWMPEYLGKEGNRLLKLIEEPTPDTVIIMVACRQEDILNTIISRVQITKISAFSVEDIILYLKQNEESSETIARQIAIMADGNLGKAISMVAGQQADYSDSLFQWMRVAYKMDPSELNRWIDEMAKWGREGQKNFLAYGLHFFREYLFWMLSGSHKIKLSEAEQETASKMKQLIDSEKAEKLVAIFDSSYKAILRNANPKIHFMADSFDIAYVMRGIDKLQGIYSV